MEDKGPMAEKENKSKSTMSMQLDNMQTKVDRKLIIEVNGGGIRQTSL